MLLSLVLLVLLSPIDSVYSQPQRVAALCGTLNGIQQYGCPPGHSQSGNIGDTGCYPVSAGCYQPSNCLSGFAPSCPNRCPVGQFSLPGASACSSCIQSALCSSASNWDFIQQPIGSIDIDAFCRCKAGYTGDCCDIPDCSVSLNTLTLMSYVFNSDRKFDQFLNDRSTSVGDAWIDLQMSAKLYMNEVFRSAIDVNGDDSLTFSEIRNYLLTRSIRSEDFACTKQLWCSKKTGICVPVTGSLDISTLIDESLDFFISKSTWMFDNSGSTEISSSLGSFSKPSLDDSSTDKGQGSSTVVEDGGEEVDEKVRMAIESTKVIQQEDALEATYLLDIDAVKSLAKDKQENKLPKDISSASLSSEPGQTK